MNFDIIYSPDINTKNTYIHNAGVKVKFTWEGSHNVEMVDKEAFDSCTVKPTIFISCQLNPWRKYDFVSDGAPIFNDFF